MSASIEIEVRALIRSCVQYLIVVVSSSSCWISWQSGHCPVLGIAQINRNISIVVIPKKRRKRPTVEKLESVKHDSHEEDFPTPTLKPSQKERKVDVLDVERETFQN